MYLVNLKRGTRRQADAFDIKWLISEGMGELPVGDRVELLAELRATYCPLCGKERGVLAHICELAKEIAI